MGLSLVLAVVSMVTIACATPRQAQLVWGGWLDRRRRGRTRAGGWLILAGSCAAALGSEDRARHLVAWIGALGPIALLAAAMLSPIMRWSRRMRD